MIFAIALHRRVSEACLVCSFLPPQFISDRLALRYSLHAPAICAGQDMKDIVITPLPVRLFVLGDRAESYLPRECHKLRGSL